MLHFTIADTVNSLLGLTGIGIAAFIAVKQHHQVQNVAKLAADTKQIAADTKEIGEYTKGLAGDTKGLAEDTKGLAGDTKGLAGDTKGLAEYTKGLAEDTKRLALNLNEITLEMAGRPYRHRVVKALFADKRQFKCFLPGKYQGKPLPSIEAGDYYALHALQYLLDSKNLELSFQDTNSARPDLTTDSIFLCSPQSNAALNCLAPPLNLPKDGIKQQSLHGIPLPCWFADQDGKKVISVHDLDHPDSQNRTIKSDAEEQYDDAKKKHENGEKVAPDETHVPTSQRDYAIILRLTTKLEASTRPISIFVLAGIHQYGTWIAGEFLRRLASEREVLNADKGLFLDNNDFLAIVYGDFDSKLLSVNRLGIHGGYMWTGNNGQWRLVPETIQNNRLAQPLRSLLAPQGQNHSPNPPGRRSSSNIAAAGQI
jgi:hypothetical protein